MTHLAKRSARPTLSPAARALRLQRIFARLQEGMSYKDIAAEEGLSRERLRQIIRASTARSGSAPDHKAMQFARLEPALRLAARGVAEGDVKAIPLLLKLVDRLDRYCDPGLFNSPLVADLMPRPKRRRRRAAVAPQAGEGGAVLQASEINRDVSSHDRAETAPRVKFASALAQTIENAQNGNGEAL
jgi:transcriptional regulator with XRE-family HTH domain